MTDGRHDADRRKRRGTGCDYSAAYRIIVSNWSMSGELFLNAEMLLNRGDAVTKRFVFLRWRAVRFAAIELTLVVGELFLDFRGVHTGYARLRPKTFS
jgi:hypothetical protein